MPNLAESGKGGYGGYLSETLQGKYLAAKKNFEDFNLSEELAVLRTVLGEVLKGIEKKEGLENVGDVTKLVREIRETLKVMAEWMERSMVPVAFLHVFQQQVVLILREEIKDDERLQRVAGRLGQVALPRDSREFDKLQSAVRGGEVPGPGT